MAPARSKNTPTGADHQPTPPSTRPTAAAVPPAPDASAATAEFRKRSIFAASVEFDVSAIRAVADLIFNDLVGGYQRPAAHRHTTPDTGQAALHVVTLALEAVQLSAVDAGERDWDPEGVSTRWHGLFKR